MTIIALNSSSQEHRRFEVNGFYDIEAHTIVSLDDKKIIIPRPMNSMVTSYGTLSVTYSEHTFELFTTLCNIHSDVIQVFTDVRA